MARAEVLPLTAADIDAILPDIRQADRDEIGSNETRTLPAATTIGQEVRFCAGVGPSTYTVSVNTPASEVLVYRSRTTGLRVSATSLDVVDSATTFVCHAVGRWTAIGY